MRNSSCVFVSSWVRRNSSTLRNRAFAQSGISSGFPEVLVPARNSVPDLVAIALIPNDVFIKPIRNPESKQKVKRDERMEVALNDDEEVVSRPHG